MKKILICCVMLSFVGVLYAEQYKVLRFNMPTAKGCLEKYEFEENSDSNYLKLIRRVKYGGLIAGASVTLGISSVAGTVGAIFCGLMPGLLYYISPVFVVTSQLDVLGGMLLYLGLAKRKLRNIDDKLIYKYEMSKVLRNAGIITLATSAVPLTGVVPYLAFGWYSALPLIIVNGVFSLIQIAVGAVFLAVGQTRLAYWEEMMLEPELSMTHDDRKGWNEGYGIRAALKIRI